jgi:hypothetical protein
VGILVFSMTTRLKGFEMLGSALRRLSLQVYERLNPPHWRKAVKSEAGARLVSASIESAVHRVVWEEPNRANTPPLHIGKSGERYSTLTGVWWLDRTTMVVAHRSGLRIGVFELDHPGAPVWVGEVAHLTDDIAAKPLEAGTWEVAVSGCWECIFSRFTLKRSAESSRGWTLSLIERKQSATEDFCHGVAYDGSGQLCWSIHTGASPRFAVGEATFRLPAPWGVRDLCEDRARRRHLAMAVSANPRRSAYDGVVTTIWYQDDAALGWQCLCALPGVHADAIDVWGPHIWIPDQLGDRLLAIDAVSGEVAAICRGNALDFPHGLGISQDGVLAVTNYGSSSVALFDADALID